MSELAPLTPEQIADLKTKHAGPLRALPALAAWLVFRRPSRHEYDRYLDTIAADQSRMRMAAWELAQACLVSPGPAALTDALDAEPAILLSDVLPLLNAMAGDERERTIVKL